jgi:cell division protein FtsQ
VNVAQASRFGGNVRRRRKPAATPKPKAKPNKRPAERRAVWLRSLAWVMTSAFALALIAGLSLACLVGFRWATTNSFFAVNEIAVFGNDRLESDALLKTAGISTGENIFEVGLAEAESRLAAEPWIERAMVKRVLPGRVEISLTEKRPAFWKIASGRLVYTDAAGRVIAPVEPENFTSLPLLVAEDAGRTAPAELSARLVSAGLPADPAKAQWIRVRGGDEVAMYFEEYDLALALDLDDVEEGAALIARAWKDLERRGELALARSMLAMDGRVWVGMR